MSSAHPAAPPESPDSEHPSSVASLRVNQAILLAAATDGNQSALDGLIRITPHEEIEELLTTPPIVEGGLGCSYLHIAIESGHAGIARLILDSLREPSVVINQLTRTDNISGENVFHIACHRGGTDIVPYLMKRLPSDMHADYLASVTATNESALGLATRAGSDGIVDYLMGKLPSDSERWAAICHTNNEGITSFHQAAKYGQARLLNEYQSVCRRVGQQNAFLFLSDNEGDTVLHHAMKNAQTPDKDYRRSAKIILDLASSVNCKKSVLEILNKEGLTPLHIATQVHQSAVELLLDETDDIESYVMMPASQDGKTALHSAVDNGNIHALKALFKQLPSGQNFFKCVNAKTTDGCQSTLLQLAAEQDTGAFQFVLNSLNQNDRYKALRYEDRNGNTALLRAAIAGNWSIIKYLLEATWIQDNEYFSILTPRNDFGWSIIHLAVLQRAGDELTSAVIRLLSSLPRMQMSRYLMHADRNGNTALHLAALLHQPQSIRMMIKGLSHRDAQLLLNKTNTDGLTAAKLVGMTEAVIVKYLKPLTDYKWPQSYLSHKRSDVGYDQITQALLL